MDAMNMDTVCRLYEVGRQRLAEDEEDEEEDQVRSVNTWAGCLLLFSHSPIVFIDWFV